MVPETKTNLEYYYNTSVPSQTAGLVVARREGSVASTAESLLLRRAAVSDEACVSGLCCATHAGGLDANSTEAFLLTSTLRPANWERLTTGRVRRGWRGGRLHGSAAFDGGSERGSELRSGNQTTTQRQMADDTNSVSGQNARVEPRGRSWGEATGATEAPWSVLVTKK